MAWALLDENISATGATKHWAHDEILGPFFGLAICRYQTEPGFYLFHCNNEWEPLADTWHETIEEAQEQAEFEYSGVSRVWQTKS